MKKIGILVLGALALAAAPVFAQDGSEVIVVTAQKRSNSSMSNFPGPIALSAPRPPVVGLKRQADSAVRNIEIMSDSREESMRQREVKAMLVSAIDRAKNEGLNLVTGQFELTQVTRASWQDHFPALAGKEDPAEDDDDDDYDDDDGPKPAYEDDGGILTIRLKVKTKLDGSIGNAQQKITGFLKRVPATGRSEIEQIGGLALTIINPDQYRDEIYRRIAKAATHAVSFYGPEYGLQVSGLDSALGWKQVSNTEVFLYIPYSFVVEK